MEKREQKSNISFDEYVEITSKLDIRVCKVISAERVPKTDKLIKMVLDTGIDEREAITNIGDQYEPEVLVGKSYPFVLNLEPRKTRGVLSAAMILASEDENTDIGLMDSNAEAGSVVL